MENNKKSIAESITGGTTFNYTCAYCLDSNLYNQIEHFSVLRDQVEGTLNTIYVSKGIPEEIKKKLDKLASDIVQCMELYDKMRKTERSNLSEIKKIYSPCRVVMQEILIKEGFMNDIKQFVSFTDLIMGGKDHGSE